MTTVTITLEDYNELHEAQVILNRMRKSFTDGSVASYNLMDFIVGLLGIVVVPGKEDA